MGATGAVHALEERGPLAELGDGASSYAEFLAAQDETVVELSGLPWMKYHGAFIPATAMPAYCRVSRAEAMKVLVRNRAIFLRYSTGPARNETNWWHMVCRSYDFERTSANTRSKIRRGLKRTEVRRVSPAWLAENGYGCHIRSHERYLNASPQSPEEFRRFLNSIDDQHIFEAWACFAKGELVGYIVCLIEDGVFLHTIDITPVALRDYAAYAIIHTILDHYIRQEGVLVSNGSRSISHATDMQDFLLKFGFEREYCDLRVIYHPAAELIVRCLYPFRAAVKRMTRLPAAHKISSALYQEELARDQEGATT